MLTHFCTFQLGRRGKVVFFRLMGGDQRHGGWFHADDYYNFLFVRAAA
jgi:hypothetical protein